MLLSLGEGKAPAFRVHTHEPSAGKVNRSITGSPLLINFRYLSENLLHLYMGPCRVDNFLANTKEAG